MKLIVVQHTSHARNTSIIKLTQLLKTHIGWISFKRVHGTNMHKCDIFNINVLRLEALLFFRNETE